jgi:hypothetical protein
VNDNVIQAGIGLTQRMREALAAIIGYVGCHGVLPSRASLAQALGCSKNNANRLMASLVERGELASYGRGGPLAGFGSDGVAVFVPPDVAARLAAFCAGRDERVPAVVADAVMLHLDELEGEVDG